VNAVLSDVVHKTGPYPKLSNLKISTDAYVPRVHELVKEVAGMIQPVCTLFQNIKTCSSKRAICKPAPQPSKAEYKALKKI